MIKQVLAAVDNSPNDESEEILLSSPPNAEESSADYDSEDFRRKVAEAAYLKAEKRGFKSGYELEDWLQAEQEVKAELETEHAE